MATNTNDTSEPTGAPTLPTKQAEVLVQSTAPTGPAVSSSDDVGIQPVNLDTPESDAAIDDIVAKEADEVLAAQDASVAAAESEVESQATEPEKHGHPIFWFIIVLLVVVIAITAYVLMNPGLELPFSG